jgi:hypothetical protein
LADNASCVPVCNTGYTLTGTTTCGPGSLTTTATCEATTTAAPTTTTTASVSVLFSSLWLVCYFIRN